MENIRETRASLHKITEWPLDLASLIYQEYPSFKLGVMESIRHYAKMFAELIKRIFENNPDSANWVIVSPPIYHNLPKSSNMLCKEVYKLLTRERLDPDFLTLVDVYFTDIMELDFNTSNDYAKLSKNERTTNYSNTSFPINKNDFHKKNVLFIDDINVTGTTTASMKRVISEADPASINWLYIIDCDAAIGQREPQLEFLLNNFKYLKSEEFATILRREDIFFTHKCISKIFSYPEHEQEYLVNQMDKIQMNRLLKFIKENVTKGDNKTIRRLIAESGL
jgi:hypoxanthine phosphoribosyltransferase